MKGQRSNGRTANRLCRSAT